MITTTFNLDYKKSKAPKTTITRDMNELTSKVGNVYEAVAIISKRANQISATLKKELDSKLQDFSVTAVTSRRLSRTASRSRSLVRTRCCLSRL